MNQTVRRTDMGDNISNAWTSAYKPLWLIEHVADYPQKLVLTSPTSGCRLVGIVRSRTQAMEFSIF
jgi:hypothetical protein